MAPLATLSGKVAVDARFGDPGRLRADADLFEFTGFDEALDLALAQPESLRDYAPGQQVLRWLGRAMMRECRRWRRQD